MQENRGRGGTVRKTNTGNAADAYHRKTMATVLQEEAMKKKPIRVQSRKAKGRKLQQRVASRIASMIGEEYGKDKAVRSREGGQAGTDVVLVGEALRKFPWSVECKAQESWSVPAWIEQAQNNKIIATNWLIVAKRSHRKPVAILDWDAFCDLFEKAKEKNNGM